MLQLLPINSRALKQLSQAVASLRPGRLAREIDGGARPLASSRPSRAFSSSTTAGSSLTLADVRSRSRSLRKIGIHSPALDAFRARQAARRSQPRGFRLTSVPLQSAVFEQRLEDLDSSLKEQLATLTEAQTRLGLEMRTVGNLNIARLPRPGFDDPKGKTRSRTAAPGVIVECQYYPQKQRFAAQEKDASLPSQGQGQGKQGKQSGALFSVAVTAPESYAGDCLFQCRAVPGHAVFVEKVKVVHAHDPSTTSLDDADETSSANFSWISFDELDADVQKRYVGCQNNNWKLKMEALHCTHSLSAVCWSPRCGVLSLI